MSEIIPALRHHDFPACCHLALEHLATMVMQAHGHTEGAIPGLGSISYDVASQIIQEFIFCVKTSRGKPNKRLTAIGEFQLLESLCGFFHHQTKESVSSTVFGLLFGGAQEEGEDRYQGRILCKLISMAVAMANSNILNAAAMWMQTVGCSSSGVREVVHTLVTDYCGSPDMTSSPLHRLPTLSALFTCNLVTAITSIYSPTGGRSSSDESVPPASLLLLVTEWVESDPRLYLLSLSSQGNMKSTLWTSPSKSNTQTPIPGLVRWCCTPISTQPATFPAELWDRLHLALLHTVLSFPTIPGASQLELITLADMYRITNDVLRVVDTNSPAIDRLVQLLQVALATGAFRCSLADLRKVFKAIPSNRLLSILEKQHLSTAPPQMHNVS